MSLFTKNSRFELDSELIVGLINVRKRTDQNEEMIFPLHKGKMID